MISKIKQQITKEKNAYCINNQKISYEDLWNKAKENSIFLQKQGTSPVIIYGHKSIDMITSILACLIANRAYIPIEVGTPTERIKNIIKISKATLCIKNEEIKIKDIDCYTLEELKKFEKETIQQNNNSIAYIIFTSGSTGNPKGVPISRENLNNFVNWISGLSPLSEYKDVNVLNQASFSFDLSVADIYYSLCNGHTLVALDKQTQENYNEIFKVIKNNKINVAIITPTFIKLCLIEESFNEKNYPDLKCLYFCGEQLEKKTVEKILNKFPNIKIINAYGPTEATSAVSASLITKEELTKEELLPAGDIKTLATDVTIENDEIIIRGPSVFEGYLDNIQGGHFRENGVNCYRTGDLGYIKDGKLYCKGRKDNQIKYKGYRIELDEIEKNIKKIEGVEDCAVVAKFSENRQVKLIKAYVVLAGNMEEEFIKKELSKKLPLYMIPKIIKKMDKLPTNKNGKIDRRLLSEL